MDMENSAGVLDIAGAGAVAVPESVTKAIRIWLVDDSENFRILLAALLEEEGSGLQCERQFNSAEAVLTALESQAPDVILLDNRMPGMGGVAAVRPIRERAPNTRVLMLTTFANQEARTRVLSDGASDFLLKSFHISEIAERVREAMLRPLPALTSVSAGDFVSDRPERRALGNRIRIVEMDGAHSRLDRQTPATDRRHHGNRWLRGVHRIRSWWKQMISREQPIPSQSA
jgi:DNA-binding response OmpR family regulator